MKLSLCTPLQLPFDLLGIERYPPFSARIFLGLAEAGLFPGITFYLSLWYRRRDIAQRIAIFFSAATIAGAFGGLLA